MCVHMEGRAIIDKVIYSAQMSDIVHVQIIIRAM